MRFLEDLRVEHDRIDAALGALRTYVNRRLRGAGDPSDGARFVAFFRLFAGAYHHHREEGVLFPALAANLSLPEDRGPMAALVAQHRELEATLTELAPLLGSALEAPAEREAIEELTRRYTHGLWAHIDAENSVLLPESEARLSRAGVRELPEVPLAPPWAAARDDGEALCALYPPSVDRAAFRGEGCVICPSYGVQCDGLEREWWNEHEWEAFFKRND